MAMKIGFCSYVVVFVLFCFVIVLCFVFYLKVDKFWSIVCTCQRLERINANSGMFLWEQTFFPNCMRFSKILPNNSIHACLFSFWCNTFFRLMLNVERKITSFWNCREMRKKILTWHLHFTALSSRLFLDNLATTRQDMIYPVGLNYLT